jgi:hypothetical protein
MIRICVWEVPSLNLGCGTANHEVFHVFPPSHEIDKIVHVRFLQHPFQLITIIHLFEPVGL